MKQMILLIAACVVIALAAMVYLRSESPLRKASLAESKGEWDKAAAKYTEALFKVVKGIGLPDKNRARVLSTDAWNNEMRQYLAWITVTTPADKRSVREAQEILDKLRGVCGRTQNVHYISNDSLFEYAEEWQMAEDWDRAFFPPNATIIKNPSALIRAARTAGVSVLRIRAPTSYAFDLSLVDLGTWKRTDFTLAPEDETAVLVRPHAPYLLICSSTVEFPDGKIWRSPKNLIDLQSPDKSSLRTFVLAGRVIRQ